MLTCQADAFRLDPDIHYLNCAYMSPLPRRVEEAGMVAMQAKRSPSHISAEDFFDTSDRVRQAFSGLIGAEDPKHVSIAPSVSYTIATAARNLQLSSGQNIVTPHEQFPSNVYTWRRRSRETGCSMRAVKPPESPEGRGLRWNERILDAIDQDTALVALPVVHWADGTLFDLETISRRARDVGAAFIVDGTQSIGALDLDVNRIRPDMIVAAGYKWLMGPYSTALAWWGPRFRDGVPIEENWITRRDSRNFARLVDYVDDYEPGAIRFDVGQRSNFILMPMLLEGLKLIREWDPAAIQAYVTDLLNPVLDAIAALGYRMEHPNARGSHLFGVRMPRHISVDAIRESMNQARISVSVRGNAIRVSPNVYNTEQDMVALVDALSRAAA